MLCEDRVYVGRWMPGELELLEAGAPSSEWRVVALDGSSVARHEIPAGFRPVATSCDGAIVGEVRDELGRRGIARARMTGDAT